MRLIYRPIETWPGHRRTPDERRSSPFDSTWSATLSLLDHELRQLDVDEAVLQVDSPNERDFRLDGQLRADAKLRSPAVILSFELDRSPIQYPCDAFDATYYRAKLEGWQCNVRAIALGLEALRKLERYGIASNRQQYTGWKQLGAGIPLEGPKMTVEDAARLIAKFAGDINWWQDVLDDAGMRKALYHDAARLLHPDVGGDAEEFKRLTAALDLLDRLAPVA